MSITLVVETGSASSSANCYASMSQATAYFVNRGITGWQSATTEQIKAALIKGAQFIDITYPWIGYKTARDQALEWPRQAEVPQWPYYTNQVATGVIGPGGWEIYTTQIPTEVVHANIEMAGRFLTETTIIADQDRLARREKVGDIEVEYEPGRVNAVKRYPVVDRILRGFYTSSANFTLERM